MVEQLKLRPVAIFQAWAMAMMMIRPIVMLLVDMMMITMMMMLVVMRMKMKGNMKVTMAMQNAAKQ